MSRLELRPEGKSEREGMPIPGHGLRIGRDPGNDLKLSDPQVSRQHALLWEERGRYYVRDENSTNGTFVNDERISGTWEIRLGDRLRLGSSVFTLRERHVAHVAAQSVRPVLFVMLSVALVAALLIASLWALRNRKEPLAQIIASPTMPLATEIIAPIWTPSPSRAEEATVVLKVPLEYEPGVFSVGSGSIVDPRGLILTNFHVIGDPDSGNLYNKDGQTYVGITTMPDGQANWRYQAKPVVWDGELDLAILDIVSDMDGGAITGALSLPTVAIGNSDALLIGEPISILGYPDVGLDTLTVTKGTVAGFVLDDSGRRLWIKTDAAISLGNSGGLAVNERGELVGVPSRLLSSVGQLGYVRPISWGLPLIQRAQ